MLSRSAPILATGTRNRQTYLSVAASWSSLNVVHLRGKAVSNIEENRINSITDSITDNRAPELFHLALPVLVDPPEVSPSKYDDQDE